VGGDLDEVGRVGRLPSCERRRFYGGKISRRKGDLASRRPRDEGIAKARAMVMRRKAGAEGVP